MLNSSRGIVTGLGVYIAILVMGMMGSVIIYNTLIAEKAKKDEWVRAQTFYTAQSAAEYALKKIYANQSPVITEPGKSFAGGNFLIEYIDPQINIKGRNGNGIYSMFLKRPTMADCVPFNTATAQIDGNDKIHHIYFQKECLPSVTLDKVKIRWTPDAGQRLTAFRIENSYRFQSPPSPSTGSDEITELNDWVLNDAGTDVISKMEFTSTVVGATFTMKIYFSDGSNSGDLTFTPP